MFDNEMIQDNGTLKLIVNNAQEIAVVIPAYNEENTIADVVYIARQSKYVKEVIVVDNCSTDDTYRKAKLAGAKVVKCLNKGKGYAMELGLKKAKSPIIVFLDGDIVNYSKNIIEKLAKPIINGKADFVKSTFSRQAGRVTEILVKPLLRQLFPSGIRFSQPLSGMISGKREYFKKIEFEKNYGVDIGILLDMISIGAKIKEVNIGKIENKMKTLQELEPMATQIAEVILRKTVLDKNSINIIDQNVNL